MRVDSASGITSLVVEGVLGFAPSVQDNGSLYMENLSSNVLSFFKHLGCCSKEFIHYRFKLQ